IKFTPKGVVSLELRAQNQEVEFRVKDTGIGIPNDKRELIFEAFKQSDGTVARKYGGTGLGLSISKELARILGGEITLKSSTSEGSVFALTLPIHFQLNSLLSSSVDLISNVKVESPPQEEVKE